MDRSISKNFTPISHQLEIAMQLIQNSLVEIDDLEKKILADNEHQIFDVFNFDATEDKEGNCPDINIDNV